MGPNRLNTLLWIVRSFYISNIWPQKVKWRMFSVHSSISKMRHSHTKEYYSVIKGIKCICHNVDELWKPHTTWKKPDTKGRMLYDPISVKQRESIHRDRKQEWLDSSPTVFVWDEKRFWSWQRWRPHNTVNVLSPAHWPYNCSFYYIKFTSIKKIFIEVFEHYVASHQAPAWSSSLPPSCSRPSSPRCWEG